MSSTFSAGLADSPLASNEPGCEPSRSVRSSHSAGASSPSTGRASPATTMFEVLPLTGSEQMELLPMSSVAASHAKTLAKPASDEVSERNDLVCGDKSLDWLANYDHASSSWKTSQICFLEKGELGLAEFSETWPRSGTMQNGTAYRLPTLAPLTNEIGSGLFPTVLKADGTGQAAILSPNMSFIKPRTGRLRRVGLGGTWSIGLS